MFVVVVVPAGFAVVSFDVPDVEPVPVVEPVVEPVEPLPVVEPVAEEPVPVPVVDEPEPVEPEPVEPEPIDESEPPIEPLPDVPVVLGVPVDDGIAVPVLDGIEVDVDVSVVVVVVPEFVVALLSGDFAGSLSPPQATEPTTSAALRTM